MASRGTRAPDREPHGLERLAALCLQADPKDTRLGDLSELYVRTHEHATRRLGTALGARLAADLHYVGASANVVIFARVIEPALRLAAPGAMAFVVTDLWERAMTTVQMSVRLIADRDPALASSQQDLSSLPQVQAALAAPMPGRQPEGKTFDSSVSCASVLSANAAVPSLGWQVFVERPVAEVWGPLWSAALRGIVLLVLGLAAVLLAGAAARRGATVPRPA